MRNREFLRAVIFLVFALSPSIGWAYGGGGEGSGLNAGSEASFSTSDLGSYFHWSDNVTNHASYEAAQDRLDAEIEQVRDPRWGLDPRDEDYYSDVRAGLAVSWAAWDETAEVSPAVRRLAAILESMMMKGALTPRQAHTMLAIYSLASQRKK